MLHHPLRVCSPRFLIRAARSVLASRHVSESTSVVPIRLNDPSSRLRILKAPGASFVINGILSVFSFMGGREPSVISLGRNSRLVIDGDFIMGDGNSIFVEDGAELFLGGKRFESATGISGKSRIMVRRKMHIGYDCVIAWNVVITDCDWHEIEGKAFQEDVFIADHVWIAANTSILKGSTIGNGSVIAAHTLVSGQRIPDKSLVAGNPLKIVATDVIWHRDLPPEAGSG